MTSTLTKIYPRDAKANSSLQSLSTPSPLLLACGQQPRRRSKVPSCRWNQSRPLGSFSETYVMWGFDASISLSQLSCDEPSIELRLLLQADRNPIGSPKYDPRTLYISNEDWKSMTPFETQFWEIKQSKTSLLLRIYGFHYSDSDQPLI